MLVEITCKYVSQNASGKQTVHSAQHFNLLILENTQLYLFEPLRQFTHQSYVEKVVSAHFPERQVIVLSGIHPQSVHKKDVYCMVYALMLSDAVLDNLTSATVLEIAAKLFAQDQDPFEKAREYVRFLRDFMPLSLTLPLGAESTFWKQNKGAVTGGAAGLLVGGPVGLVVGAIGGNVLYDKPRR